MSKPLPLTVSVVLARVLKLLDRLSAEDRERVMAALVALGGGKS